MKRLIFILVFFSVFLFSSCNKEQKEGKNKDDVAKKDDVFKTTCYIKSEELKKAGNHYIVKTHFTKYFKAEPVRELLIFNLNGELIRKIKNFSYDLVKIVNNNPLCFIDDKENLIDLKINIEN